MHVIKQSSGYAGTPNDWMRFLSCWYNQAKNKNDYYRSVLHDVGLRRAQVADDATARAEVVARGKQLGVELPRSYVDFVIAYRPTEPSEWVGFFPIDSIGTMESIDPELVAAAERYPINAPKSEYFVYGPKQNTFRRSEYLRRAIAVGRYGDSQGEYVTLNPQVRTLDGEMETELHAHGASIRVPSFAEAMRQLYLLYVLDFPDLNFYNGRSLGCADLLPMKEIWWM